MTQSESKFKGHYLKNIHFIVNPAAGSGNHLISREFLENFFEEENYAVTIKNSNYKKHAKALTLSSINEGADIIVACGGDGTINEVASCLVSTNVLLGIIPLGSGNGLASNLKIPKTIESAIALIKTKRVKKIDVGLINDHFLFSNTGLGIDALLDVLIVSKISRLKSLFFGFLILIKKHHLLKEAQSYQANKIKISQANKKTYQSQIDGEFFNINSDAITISLLEQSLHVIA